MLIGTALHAMTALTGCSVVQLMGFGLPAATQMAAVYRMLGIQRAAELIALLVTGLFATLRKTADFIPGLAAPSAREPNRFGGLRLFSP